MASSTKLSSRERIAQLLRHLGMERAHVAARVPEDWRGLVAGHPEIFASFTLVCPLTMEPDQLLPLSSPTLILTGDLSPVAQMVHSEDLFEIDVGLAYLSDYVGAGLDDMLVDRKEEAEAALLNFLSWADSRAQMESVNLPPGEGEFEGIAYSIQGNGPPLVLLPLGLAASQWRPILPALAERYCTITLGGPKLGYAGILESRGRSGGVVLMRTMLDDLAIQPGDNVLDVGCGTGVLDRWLAYATNKACPTVGVDTCRYLVEQARYFSERQELGSALEFIQGNGELLPFADDNFDVVLSVAVMDFVDVNKMLAEMVRVAKRGGRVAAVVAALDIPSIINLPVSSGLKHKVENMLLGYASSLGCADASLYARFHQAGLRDVRLLPQLAAFDDPTTDQFLEDILALRLPTEEADEWRRAEARTRTEGTFFVARPFHCAIGTKPRAI